MPTITISKVLLEEVGSVEQMISLLPMSLSLPILQLVHSVRLLHSLQFGEQLSHVPSALTKNEDLHLLHLVVSQLSQFCEQAVHAPVDGFR